MVTSIESEIRDVWRSIEHYTISGKEVPDFAGTNLIRRMDKQRPEEVNKRTKVTFFRHKKEGYFTRNLGWRKNESDYEEVPCTYFNDILRFERMTWTGRSSCRAAFYSYRYNRTVHMDSGELTDIVVKAMRKGYLVGQFLHRSSGGYHVIDPIEV